MLFDVLAGHVDIEGSDDDDETDPETRQQYVLSCQLQCAEPSTIGGEPRIIMFATGTTSAR